MAAILYTLLFLMGGLLIVRLLLPLKRPLVRIYMGLALGVLLMMQLPALCARLLDFTIEAHMLAIVALLALTALCYPLRERRVAARMQPQDRRQLAVMAAVGIPLTVLSAYLQYTHILMPAPDGSLWCGQSTYGDLCMHLAFVTSMKDAAFPPAYSLLAGTPMAYPYLADSLSTSFLLLGLPLNWALIVPGTLLMALTYAGYMLLAQQILGGRHKAVAVAALLFFFNGGLGFLYDFDMAFKDGFARVREIFTGYYRTPANQPELNLRFSNVIADLLIPQRSLLGGWAMVLPALMLLISSQRERSMRQTVILAVWAGALPLVHTHTFLALGLFSGGYLLGRLIVDKNDRRGVLKRAGVYLGIVLALALPQVLSGAIRQTVEGGVLRFQFNWVNNSGGRGLIDGWFFFWVKNVGLPFILIVCACLNARRRGQLDLVLGMTAIFAVAETILFQRNEYDNNKLFYIWYMFGAILAADYGSVLMQRLAGLGGRRLLCALFIGVSVLSGALSIAREAVSGYQLFSRTAVDAGKWVEENTDRDAVFLTGQQHINPVASLAGRQIICGSDLYVFFHGLSYAQQAEDCRRFLEDPESNADVLKTYGVDYIYVSDYERADFDVDMAALEAAYPVVYENADVTIYAVTQ
ncbi:MAG: hypothetical protein PUH70_04895 [Clostridiales bacterium]|nr:hypothetical protein [Clostridiales bacterium]MDY5515230.1 hypothetical protein [Candidatus Ventricola sp.]